MVEIYDSHEQSERVKGWLRENGSAIVIGLALAFGGLFGFKQWQIWQENKARRASAEYEVMIQQLGDDQLDAAVDHFETLKAKYPNSAYVPLAALHMAAARVEAEQPDLAVSLLEFAMESAEPLPLRAIARERLARIRLDQGDIDEALQLIDNAPNAIGFESRFAELRGDALLAQGHPGEAAAAYQQALDLQESGVGFRPLLEMKLEALSGASSPEAGS